MSMLTLVVLGVVLTPWVGVGGVNAFQSLNGATSNSKAPQNVLRKKGVRFATRYEIIHNLRNCREEVGIAFAHCDQGKHSCNARCGQVMTWNPELDQIQETTKCSCDVLCRVYGDCCWDFKAVCRSTSRKYAEWKRFFGSEFEVECIQDFALISSCKNAPNNGHEKFEEDPREVVVSEAGEGLHFKNRHVYSSCKEGGRLLLHNMTRWRKIVRHPEPITELPHLHAFFSTGQLSEAISPHIFDEPTDDITPRACFLHAVMICGLHRITTTNASCLFFNSMRVKDLNQACRYLDYDVSENFDRYKTTMESSSVSSLISSSSISSTSGEMINISPSSTLTHASGVSDETASAPKRFHIHPLCKTNIIASGRSSSSAFTLLVDVDDNLRASLVQFHSIYGWAGLYCSDGLFTGNSTCTPKFTCETGKINTGFGQCEVPIKMELSVECHENKKLRFMIHTVLWIMNEENLDIELDENYVETTERLGFTLTFSFTVLNYSFADSGKPQLDFTMHLIKALMSKGESLFLESGDNATVCLKTPHHVFFRQPGLCDDLFKDGKLSLSLLYPSLTQTQVSKKEANEIVTFQPANPNPAYRVKNCVLNTFACVMIWAAIRF